MKPPRKKKEQERKAAEAARGNSASTPAVRSIADTVSSAPKNVLQSHAIAAKSEGPAPSTVSGGDNLDAKSTHEENKFIRRPIVSNWDRYEKIQENEESDDEDAGAKERQSLSLLSSAGGASSRFRFKDELDWEESGDSELLSDFQKLNLDNLALSLSCVPLHERLGIELGVFLDEQITEFDDMAYANRQIFYKQKIQESHPAPPILDASQPIRSANIDPAGDRSIALAGGEITAQTPARDKAELTEVEAPSSGIGTEEPRGAAALPEELEDELDFLLDMPTKKTYEQPAATISSQSVQIDDFSKPKPSPAPLKPEFQLQKQDLDDDWLDSLLGD